MVEPAPGGECRPADAGTSQSGSCGLGDARGSSECLVTAGGGEGCGSPSGAVAVGTQGWLEAGRSSLSVQSCPVIYLGPIQRKEPCGHCQVVPQTSRALGLLLLHWQCRLGPRARPPPGSTEQGAGPGLEEGLLSGQTEDS